jgi:hypothetical protein
MLVMVASLLGACSSAPPQTPDDVCAMFEERPGWYDDARDAREAWGLPSSRSSPISAPDCERRYRTR